MKLGAFTFVLHTHIPYVRKTGRWPHGEEMLHEAMAESYVPLLNALYDLKEEGIEPRLTMDLSPILLEQLADNDVKNNFELYLQERLALAESEIATHDRKKEAQLSFLARWYRDYIANILTCFRERYRRDLPDAFRRLSQADNIDVLTSAATHGYLPLFDRDSSIYGQLKTGLQTSHAILGFAPRGVWSPECGYRPAYMCDHQYKPGLDEFFADLNLGYFIVDSHAISGDSSVAGPPSTASPGRPAVISIPLPARKVVVRADDRTEAKNRTTMRPYYSQATNVSVLGRDERTGMQVWSETHGYPGAFAYREFHRRDANSGLHYWRITAAETDLGQKELYDPYPAFQQVQIHAGHFVNIVCQSARDYYFKTGAPGIVVSAYDTELFGHWWFEGIAWLKQVLKGLAKSQDVELTTAQAFLEANPPQNIVALPECSWGAGGGHAMWLNTETEWMWSAIHSAERTMEELVAKHPVADGDLLAVLNQTARELLLMQASDWPFLVSTGQAREYASSRFQHHLARFNNLVSMAHKGELDPTERRFLESVGDLDNPFKNIGYGVFAARE